MQTIPQIHSQYKLIILEPLAYLSPWHSEIVCSKSSSLSRLVTTIPTSHVGSLSAGLFLFFLLE